MSRIPENLSVVHSTGDKSFAELLKNHRKQIKYAEAPAGEQLDLNIIKMIYQFALGLARQNPKNKYQFSRVDIDTEHETESNRPFKKGKMTKRINMFGDIFDSDIEGKHD
jgi:hypothetical protein